MSYSMVRPSRLVLRSFGGPTNPEHDWCGSLLPGSVAWLVCPGANEAINPGTETPKQPSSNMPNAAKCPDGTYMTDIGPPGYPNYQCTGYGIRSPDEEGGEDGSGSGSSSGGGYNTTEGNLVDVTKPTPSGQKPVQTFATVPVVATGTILGLIALMLLL